jgi:glyoxylase-like metal-dependent hydrolase (beta-lactamase superfamily II)
MERPPEIRLGSTRIVFLTDGFWRNDGGCMFGVVPRELWKRNHPPDDLNRIRLNLTCPLIIRGADAILVDTGIGNRLDEDERRIFDHGEGWMRDGLRAIGMEAGDITAVVLSHLHFDHCGGIVRRLESGRLEAAFPRARLFIQRGELEAARSRNERLRAAYRHVEECLAPNVKSIEAMEGERQLAPGVVARVSGGHTRDHQVVLVRDGPESFAHLADIVPTRSHLAGPWNQAYDLDALTTMERKAEYLAQAVEERSWVSFAHDDRIYAARIVLDGARFRVGETIPALQRD